MNVNNPINGLLVYSLRTHGKLVLLALLLTFIVGVLVSVFAGHFPQNMLVLFLSDTFPKITILIAPFILMSKDKSYSEWKESIPNMRMTKKDFTTGIYINTFLSAFAGIPVLALIWGVASLINPGSIDFNEGLGVIGGALCLVWTMTGLLYTLQFTKLKKNGDMLFIVCAAVSLGFAVALTQIGIARGLSAILIAALLALIGLIVLLICRPITVKLYEKTEL